MSKIDDKKLCQEALDLINRHGTAAAAEQASGVSQRTLRDRVDRAMKRHGLVPAARAERVYTAPDIKVREVEPKALLAADRKVKAVSEDKKDLAAKLKASEAELAELSKQLDLMKAIEDGQGSRTIKIDRPVNTDGQGIFCGVLSDLHLEESVTPESIPGYENEFNLDIARARMEKVFQSYVFMLESWRHVGTCDTAVLALLGDLITNGIHEDAAESNNLGPSKAILMAQELIGAGIEYILSNSDLDKIILPCCSGNHDRTTKKPRIATATENSWSYLLYQTMQREWRKEKRLDWRVAEGYHVYTDLYDTRVRWHHGDAVSYGGGIGGITVPLRKKIAAWNSGNPNPADLDVLGHFHQLLDGGNFIVNGSLIGFNAYALNIGASAEPPQQACFWIDSERGKTMTGRLFVE